MADGKTGSGATSTDAPREPKQDSPPVPKGGKQAQVDEAKDEGLGKQSVPIDDVTTENDK